MGSASSYHENEIKLRIESAGAGLALLERAQFSVSKPRVFETNTVYDTPELTLRNRKSLVRVRRAGDTNVLTFKGPASPGPHKTREELETGVGDAAVMERILERLGLSPVFRYEKYRTEMKRPGGPGLATVDETPIGCFLELEGPPEWVDATAAALGYSARDYITSSYGALYLDWCREHRIEPGDLVFR